MEYLYENLGDETFQEFCHCLINNDFKNTQAFPVGQPDGGRDSIAYLPHSSKKDFIIFQVKYVRNPHQERDIHKWLVDTINKEIIKIKRLIPRGAKAYYLITNVKGTAHLDAGAIDKLQKILDENIDIPSYCWWRDDLSRKLDSNPILKWSFPQILTGQDILNSILFENINESKEKRRSVVKAYLADQYEMDKEVKFKQIELQNRLLDLFVDVPIRIKKFNRKDKKLGYVLYRFEKIDSFNIEEEELFGAQEENGIGAALFLLSPLVQQDVSKLVLEGGPGQGKSTISQYICQIHRARLLNKETDFKFIPEAFLKVPVRLPFKIDLRDIATWVEGENPYIGVLNEESFSQMWSKSLESFLVAHIGYHSKIIDFNSVDLISIFKFSSILLVLDGFDEIANLNVREEIISFVNKGINRLSQNSKSIQIIITSRPAALSTDVCFAIEDYPSFELADIKINTINTYVEKWIKARKLNNREANEIKRLVEEKLEMPHLRDLAKSPMQLAILISLLNTRGESLPNKRTSLYDSYIELFFNRESEKNATIRDNRDLIIDIHKYLAWVLHSEAEMYKNNGRIELDKLTAKLKEYLENEGHKTDIANQLFTVMKERVCALVSRVQGTFEFEVQPLREYFCAKYLYETSPYSPAGSECSGTKPERFDAISRNFYWQNVVRFFAGCFDKGELPMLIHKLRELQNDLNLKHTNYPRIITAQLLSDWVFTQYPILLKDVVEIIIDGLNIGEILNQNFEGTSNDSILLPEGCGRKEIVEECFKQLREFPNIDYASELISLITDNPYRVIDYWEAYVDQIDGEQLTTWLEYGYLLGILHRLNKEILLSILQKDPSEKLRRFQIIINGRRIDIIQNDLVLKEVVLNGILNEELIFAPIRSESNSLSTITLCLNGYTLASMIKENRNTISFSDFINRRFRYYHRLNRESEKGFPNFPINDGIDKKIEGYFKAINKALNTDLENYRREIEPWDILIESGRNHFGDNWKFNLLSIIAAGIKSKEEKFESFSNLGDSSLSLCKRVRYARLKSGNVTWWRNELVNSKQIVFSLLIFFTWATPKTIKNLMSVVSSKIEELKDPDFKKLIRNFKQIAHLSTFTSVQQRYIENILEEQSLTNSIKYILSLRVPQHKIKKFLYDNIKNYTGDIEDILQSQLEFLINQFLKNPKNGSTLPKIKHVYSNLKRFNDEYYRYNMYPYRHHMYSQEKSTNIPYDIAKNIMEECKNYPRVIVFLSEKACRSNADKNLYPIGKVAQENIWFGECSIKEESKSN